MSYVHDNGIDVIFIFFLWKIIKTINKDSLNQLFQKIDKEVDA